MSHVPRRHVAPIITAIILIWAVGRLGMPSVALASTSSPGLYVPAAILVTTDGGVVYAKNADKPRRIASCTKLLTALVVMEHRKLDDVVRVSSQAAEVDDGAVGLKTGRKYTVRDLLEIMLVKSANGAAEALATNIGGSEKKFVAMMIAKAKSLGLKHTKPADPHGLSPHGYSTAAELSVIARKFMEDPELRRIVLMRTDHFGSGTFGSTDHLLWSYRGAEGVKTGYTDPAGYCFVGAAKRDDVELFGVILGAEVGSDRFTQTRRLLDWGFARVKVQPIVSTNATRGAVTVRNGAEQTVTARTQKAVDLAVWSDKAPSQEVSLPVAIVAPVRAGQELGVLTISRGGGSVPTTVALIAEKDVAAAAPKPVAWGSSAGKKAGGAWWSPLAAIVSGFGRLLGI